jgi:hypothetical protein
MHRTPIKHAIFLVSLLAASAAFGGSDIVKCVDQDGRTTLTDEPCQAGSASVTLEAGSAIETTTLETRVRHSSAALAQVSARVMPERANVPPFQARKAPAMARDVATLKAARENMHLMDTAANALRNQRYAGLN